MHEVACIVSDVGSQLPWENFDRFGAALTEWKVVTAPCTAAIAVGGGLCLMRLFDVGSGMKSGRGLYMGPSIL